MVLDIGEMGRCAGLESLLLLCTCACAHVAWQAVCAVRACSIACALLAQVAATATATAAAGRVPARPELHSQVRLKGTCTEVVDVKMLVMLNFDSSCQGHAVHLT